MNESSPVFYKTSSPSGPLPCSPSLKFTITQSRATGIADHILPLGDLLPFSLIPVPTCLLDYEDEDDEDDNEDRDVHVFYGDSVILVKRKMLL